MSANRKVISYKNLPVSPSIMVYKAAIFYLIGLQFHFPNWAYYVAFASYGIVFIAASILKWTDKEIELFQTHRSL